MELEDLIVGVLFTSLFLVVFTVWKRIVERYWTWFINLLVYWGFPPSIEYILALLLLLLLTWLGVIQLRKPRGV